MNVHSLSMWFRSLFSQRANESSELPYLEALEARIAPAIFASVSHGTLKITGDELDNQIVITADASDPTKFTISSPIDTINGSIEDLVVTGVKNISIKSKWGDDKITFDGATPISLAGNLSINQGFGHNYITADDLSVGGKFSLKAYEGKSRYAFYEGTLTDLNVGGQTKFIAGPGSNLTITTSEEGQSILGSLSMRSPEWTGTTLRLFDTTILGNLEVKGESSTLYVGGDHGLSTIRGDLKFSSGGALILNGIVEGDAKLEFNHLSAFVSSGVGENVAAEIHGDLSISQKRVSILNMQIAAGSGDAGLTVGGDLDISSSKRDDTYDIKYLQVTGSSKISLGDGRNSFELSDSSFEGAFSLKAGRHQDTFSIDTESVVFAVPPKIDPGAQPAA